MFISFLLFASFLAHAGGRPLPVDPKETSLQVLIRAVSASISAVFGEKEREEEKYSSI